MIKQSFLQSTLCARLLEYILAGCVVFTSACLTFFLMFYVHAMVWGWEDQAANQSQAVTPTHIQKQSIQEKAS